MRLGHTGFLLLIGLTLVGGPALRAQEDSQASLAAQLEARAQASKTQVPAEAQAVMQKAIDDLRASGIVQKAIHQGDAFPSFTLTDIQGHKVASQELLAQGPLVVVFYRGGWCPYCSLALQSLQKSYAAFKAQGAELVAIAPETPAKGSETSQKQSLTFRLLTDSDNTFARRLGIVYELPPDLQGLYGSFGLDLPKTNGSKKWELPLGATYVVSRSGKVVYAFLDPDYKKRAEPSTILVALQALKGQ